MTDDAWAAVIPNLLDDKDPDYVAKLKALAVVANNLAGQLATTDASWRALYVVAGLHLEHAMVRAGDREGSAVAWDLWNGWLDALIQDASVAANPPPDDVGGLGEDGAA